MLITTQDVKKEILIGTTGFIKITLLEIGKNKIRLGITAPKEMPIIKKQTTFKRNETKGD